MAWNPDEAIAYFKAQGAPRDQNALVNLLKEVQSEHGGEIPKGMLPSIAQGLQTKESLLLALIKRIPSLRLANTHLLEVCAGPNCGKSAKLAAFAESLESKTVTVKFVPCMRSCAKGPNVKWDGTLYHQATEDLLRRLTAAPGNL